MTSRRLRRELQRRKVSEGRGVEYRYEENKLIALIEELKEWRDLIDDPTEDFMQDFKDLFGLCANALSVWSANPQDDKSNQKAESVASALVDSYRRLGELFPPNFNAFGRDVFDVGKFHVEVAQYFRGSNYYAGDNSIKKMVRWSVFHGKSVIMRYYLERSDLVLPCYILGLQSRQDRAHTQVHVYGPTRPSYAKLKTDMLTDLSARMHDTIHSLRADEQATMSTANGLVSPRPVPKGEFGVFKANESSRFAPEPTLSQSAPVRKKQSPAPAAKQRAAAASTAALGASPSRLASASTSDSSVGRSADSPPPILPPASAVAAEGSSSASESDSSSSDAASGPPATAQLSNSSNSVSGGGGEEKEAGR